ncbi:plasmid fertility inhibition factor family protein [Stenotrophomonas acidaminiphila]|uniref:plasmid fertility inhibition factor family protein n=1 Tax=Stenotrophomonas acidaminiphila TaxID=128780 RepID=UPI001FAEFEEA|nr:hypothetical protein [Stenotrophomonas acidaminiphila]
MVGLTPDRVVWEVATAAGPRLMYQDSRNNMDQMYFVHVEARRFYLGMLHAGGGFLRTTPDGNGCLPRALMHTDYKFEKAAENFAVRERPIVDLAFPSPGLNSGELSIDFNDGTTRTYWLLANDCPAFPVRVSGLWRAELLMRHAGISMANAAALFDADSERAWTTAGGFRYPQGAP